MSYQISLINNLVHVAVAPCPHADHIALEAMWQDLRATCAKHGKRHVLIEDERPQGALNSSEILRQAAQDDSGAPLRIALCSYHGAGDAPLPRLLADANGGRCTIQIFDALDPALRWLGA